MASEQCQQKNHSSLRIGKETDSAEGDSDGLLGNMTTYFGINLLPADKIVPELKTWVFTEMRKNVMIGQELNLRLDGAGRSRRRGTRVVFEGVE
jgi:hypothetical protein